MRGGSSKGDSPEQQRAKGETRPSRQVVTLFPDHASRPDPEVIPPPAWLSPAGKRIWATKVDRYRQRGQKVGGFEESLAQYCALEADLIAIWRRKQQPTMAAVTAHRIWAAEFFDTPASQKVKLKDTAGQANAFARNGKREAS